MEITAATLPELFQSTADQLLTCLYDPQTVGETVREKIVLEAPDIQHLLEAWLNGLLGIARREHMIFRRFRFEQLAKGPPASLRAEAWGELIDPLRHEPKRSLVGLSSRVTRLAAVNGGWMTHLTLGS